VSVAAELGLKLVPNHSQQGAQTWLKKIDRGQTGGAISGHKAWKDTSDGYVGYVNN